MRTWRQGVVGEIATSGERVFIKCLKYPLAGIYRTYIKEDKKLENLLFYAFTKVEIIKVIDKIECLKLNKKEKELGIAFEMNFDIGTITLINFPEDEILLGVDKRRKKAEIYDLEKITLGVNKYMCR